MSPENQLQEQNRNQHSTTRPGRKRSGRRPYPERASGGRCLRTSAQQCPAAVRILGPPPHAGHVAGRALLPGPCFPGGRGGGRSPERHPQVRGGSLARRPEDGTQRPSVFSVSSRTRSVEAQEGNFHQGARNTTTTSFSSSQVQSRLTTGARLWHFPISVGQVAAEQRGLGGW